MIVFQTHNQVLYHLMQLLPSVSSRSASVVSKRQEKTVCSNAENVSDSVSSETAKNYMQLAAEKLSKDREVALGIKKYNVWITLDHLSSQVLRKPSESSHKSHWKTSYISGSSFTDNKHGFPCSHLTEPVILPVLRLSVKQQQQLLRCGYTPVNVQVRGFKTRRNVKVDIERNPPFTSRLKMFLRPGPEEVAVNELDTGKSSVFNENIPVEEQKKIKLAFVEGYEAGVRRQMQKNFVLKVFQKLFVFTFIIVALYLGSRMYRNKEGGSVFRLSLSNNHEVNPEEVHVTFNDIRGVEEAKHELQNIVEFLKNPSKFSALGGKLPKGVLLVGPPGTGKTLLARAIAGEAGVPFFHVAGSEFDEVLVGQGARRVRDLFTSAKLKAPCLIFIDEIDCIGSARVSSMLHPYANQTINQLLSEMDGFYENQGVIVLGATNRPKDLDKALLRPGRFDLEIPVDAPTFTGRKEIFNLYLGKVVKRDIDVDYLARTTTGFTGADIENMVNQAALQAAIDGSKYITMKHLELAKDRVLMGPERAQKIQNEQSTRITAFHEAGHTVVAHYTKDSKPVDKVTIVPRGRSLGHTSILPPNDMDYITKSALLANIDTMMGGRAAEELIFGPDKITTGASNDFEKATMIAENMVRYYGMSEKVGFRIHHQKNRLLNAEEYGPLTNELIDSEIRRILDESYERAKRLLKLHLNELKTLADTLLKYETLTGEEVKAVLEGKELKKEV